MSSEKFGADAKSENRRFFFTLRVACAFGSAPALPGTAERPPCSLGGAGTNSTAQQRMYLHRGFMLAKPRPREQGETQVDGGRVERIESVVLAGHALLELAVGKMSNQLICLASMWTGVPVSGD
jgi:hypothetical protein